MKQYRITVLAGDGIGPEIVREAVKVMDAAGERFGFSLGVRPKPCWAEQLRRKQENPSPNDWWTPARLRTLCCRERWEVPSGILCRAASVRRPGS